MPTNKLRKLICLTPTIPKIDFKKSYIKDDIHFLNSLPQKLITVIHGYFWHHKPMIFAMNKKKPSHFGLKNSQKYYNKDLTNEN